MKYKVGDRAKVIDTHNNGFKIGEIVEIKGVDTRDNTYECKGKGYDFSQWLHERQLEPITNKVTKEEINQFILGKLGLKEGDKFNIEGIWCNPHTVKDGYIIDANEEKRGISWLADEEIEKIEEPKKYYWKLKGFKKGYLNLSTYFSEACLEILGKNPAPSYKTQFTEDEVKELANKYKFKLSAFEKEEIA